MRAVRLALAAALALLAAACLPVTTTAPAGASAGFVNDAALEGLWVGKVDPKEPAITYFHFVGRPDNSFTLIGVTPGHGTEAASWGTYALTTATLGKNRYINARETIDDGAPASPEAQARNIPLLYTVAGKKLTLYLIDEKKAKAAIEAGTIAGTIQSGDFGDVILTADSTTLDEFLKTPAGAALFTPFMTLKRVE